MLNQNAGKPSLRTVVIESSVIRVNPAVQNGTHLLRRLRMKINLTFKTPDCLDAVDEQVEDKDECVRIKDRLKKWIEYEEYVRLIYDTDTDTCVVRAN